MEVPGIEPGSGQLPKSSSLHALLLYPQQLSPSNSAEALLTLFILPVPRESETSASTSGLRPFGYQHYLSWGRLRGFLGRGGECVVVRIQSARFVQAGPSFRLHADDSSFLRRNRSPP